jgi:hypothetical protein
MADNDAAFQQAVQQAVQAYLAQMRPLPTPSPVTEIVIRTGSADAVSMMGHPPAAAAAYAAAPASADCICIGGATSIKNLEQLPFTQEENDAIQAIVDSIPDHDEDTRTEVIHALLARVIGERAPDGLAVQPPPSGGSGPVSAAPAAARPAGPGPAGAALTPTPPAEGAPTAAASESTPATGARRAPRRSGGRQP